MDKKLQIIKNVNKDVKNYFGKPRKSDIAREKSIMPRQNLKTANGAWSQNHRNDERKSSKSDVCLPLSLSNEDFIMANAQILIKESSSTLTDVYDQWENILQINFYSEEELRCPICLSPPEVSRTDKCGHVYCLPCLLKYLSLKSDFNNKCALCGQNIDIKRVKRAGVISVFPTKTSDVLSMLLMKRDKVGSPPLPIDSFTSHLPQWNSLESRFSNVAVCPNDDLLSIIQIEMITLKDQLTEASLEERNDRLLSITKAIEAVQNDFEEMSTITSIRSKAAIKRDIETFDDFKEIVAYNNVFYQTEDGSNVFMCPVNWKCMRYEFLDQGKCLPHRISAAVIDVEKYIVTPEFQNRYRYLQHLPQGSCVTFVELDLQKVICSDTLERFSLALKQKSDSRINKQIMEEILTCQKIKHEDSFNTCSRFIHLDSLMKSCGPESFTDDDFLPLNSFPTTETSSNHNQGRSFADILHKPMTSLTVTEADETNNPSRGISLKDCLVVKKSKRKFR